MSFFDRPARAPEPKPREPTPIWAGPPEGVLPAFSTQRGVLAHTDRVFVGLDQFLVYPNGLLFTLTLLMREHEDDAHHPPWEWFRGRDDSELPENFARFGVLLSDGSKWTNLDFQNPYDADQVHGPVVMSRGGGGGGRRWAMRHWLWPLPPDGDLTFVLEWPSEGVAETQVVINATELREDSTAARQIWPADD